jgi:hypothetical protein
MILGHAKYTNNSGLQSSKPALSDIEQVRKYKRSVKMLGHSLYWRKFSVLLMLILILAYKWRYEGGKPKIR